MGPGGGRAFGPGWCGRPAAALLTLDPTPPVYVNPALLDGISPAVKKRMQGKSCFDFTKVDPAVFEELAALT